MNKRAFLKNTLRIMFLLGLGFISWLFFSGLSSTDKQENAAWVECDVSRLIPGQVIQCAFAVVYKRTDTDKKRIDDYVNLLDDPASARSTQPDSVKNKWRSENTDYFIFLPIAPVKKCRVALQRPTSSWGHHSEKRPLSELPFFSELCDGRAWDTSGRLYRRDDYPNEFNLKVPQVKWLSDTRALIRFQ